MALSEFDVVKLSGYLHKQMRKKNSNNPYSECTGITCCMNYINFHLKDKNVLMVVDDSDVEIKGE